MSIGLPASSTCITSGARSSSDDGQATAGARAKHLSIDDRRTHQTDSVRCRRRAHGWPRADSRGRHREQDLWHPRRHRDRLGAARRPGGRIPVCRDCRRPRRTAPRNSGSRSSITASRASWRPTNRSCRPQPLRIGDVAYMGDDVVDLAVLARAGLAAAPADAVDEVRSRVHWVSAANGGDGAARDLIELVLRAQNLLGRRRRRRT